MPRSTVWLAAFNRHDIDEVVKLYAPDATLLATASPALLEDSAAIRAYYDYLPGSRVGVVLDKRRTVMLGDALVLCMGFYTFTLLNDGNHNPHHARFTMLLVKRGEDWLILHHHSSRRPQPTR
jgi:uncharacterized protein (TIGR02246 family)